MVQTLSAHRTNEALHVRVYISSQLRLIVIMGADVSESPIPYHPLFQQEFELAESRSGSVNGRFALKM